MIRRFFETSKTGTEEHFSSRFLLRTLILVLVVTSGSCSVFATRPVQDMSDTEASLMAAKEVQADTLAPELYRQANEWFFKARKEYRFKNFALAKDYAIRSRRFAEQAEFEALRNGGNRVDVAPPDQAIQTTVPGTPIQPTDTPTTGPSGADSSPYSYPSPQGTPADEYMQRKAEDDARKARESQLNQATPTPTGTETPAVLVPPTFAIPTTPAK